MKKKLLTVLLAVATVLAMGGCGLDSEKEKVGAQSYEEDKLTAESEEDTEGKAQRESEAEVETLYLFNGKGENAQEFANMCAAFTEETGIPTEPFSVGSGEDTLEPLRAQMNSDTPPAVFTIGALRGLKEWVESGRALDMNTVDDEEFQELLTGIPKTMQLSLEGGENYGIPWGVEGRGYIVDARMLNDLFGEDKGSEVMQELRTCSYEDFKLMCEKITDYISSPSAQMIMLNGKEFTLQETKQGRAVNLTGVFAFPGAEKWVYSDHLLIVPMATVAINAADADTAGEEQIDKARSAFYAYAEALDFETTHAAGSDGPAARGADFVTSSSYGYDQTVAIFAQGKALFMQQGNWASSNIQNVDEETWKNCSFIPIKMPFTAEMIQNGRTVDEINSSIALCVGNYYGINAKASETAQREAVTFLKWMMKAENVDKWIRGEFKAIPYTTTDDMVFTDPLAASIQTYMLEEKTFNDTVIGTPASWAGENVGVNIMENYLTKENWEDGTYDEIADFAVEKWKELK